MYKANQRTVEMASFGIEGHVIDHSWYHIIKKENGKTDPIAIMLLSDIFYWYKPCHQIDKATGQHKIHKKFESDILQRSYPEIEKMFGFTKDQARDAFITLESLGIAERESRTIEINGVKVPNILYIKFNHERLSELMTLHYLSAAELKKSITSSEISDPILGNQEPYPRKKPSNTEISTETSTKTSSSSKKEDDDFLIFNDFQREELNNYTPKQIQEAANRTNLNCHSRDCKVRVKYFFTTIRNLRKELKKPKGTPHEALSKTFKNGELYNQAECNITEEAISFTRGMRYESIDFKYFSWDKFQKLCESFGIEFKR